MEPLGRLLQRLVCLSECLGQLWERLRRLLEPTWELLGVSWAQLGASRIQLGVHWEPLELHLALPTGLPAPLGLHLFSKWPPSVTWTALGLSTELQAPFEVLLEIFGGPLEAARAAITNRGSSVLPKGLLSATAVHCQRELPSPDGDNMQH